MPKEVEQRAIIAKLTLHKKDLRWNNILQEDLEYMLKSGKINQDEFLCGIEAISLVSAHIEDSMVGLFKELAASEREARLILEQREGNLPK